VTICEKAQYLFDFPRADSNQQVGYQHHPCLNLYSIDAFTIEEMQRKVLLQLFV